MDYHTKVSSKETLFLRGGRGQTPSIYFISESLFFTYIMYKLLY